MLDMVWWECSLPVWLASLLNHFNHVQLCNPIDCSPPGSCPWGYSGKSTGVGCHFLLQEIFRTRDRTQMSFIAGRFFTWVTREALTCVVFHSNTCISGELCEKQLTYLKWPIFYKMLNPCYLKMLRSSKTRKA